MSGLWLVIVISLGLFGGSKSQIQPCDCLRDALLSFIEAQNISSFIFIKDTSIETSPSQCSWQDVASYGYMWRSGRQFSVIDYPETPEDINTLLSHHTFILYYTRNIKNILHEASSKNILSSSIWIILIEKQDIPQLEAATKKLRIFIDSQIYLLSPTEENCFLELTSIYRIGPKSDHFQTEYIGLWTYSSGLTFNTTLDTYVRRSDLKGYPLKGVGVNVFKFFTTYLPGGGVSGYVGDIVTTLQRKHNFNLSYKTLPGYAYGKIIPGTNNTWTGMVGELQNQTVDLTVSELSITVERAEVVSYTQPIFIISRQMFVAVRKDNLKKMLAYTRPMESVLYLCIAISSMAFFVGFVFISAMKKKHGVISSQDDLISGSKAAWFVISSLLQQGSNSHPHSVSLQVLFWFMYFTAVVFYTAYSATLVSQLAVVKPATLPFTNMFELSKLEEWDAGSMKNDLFEVEATQTCSGLHVPISCKSLKSVWKNNVLRSPDNLVNSYEEGLKKTLQKQYVFVGVDISTNFYINSMPKEEACTIKALPERYLLGGVAIGMQLESPFKGLFDRSLQVLRETGTMEKLKKKYFGQKLSCQLEQKVTADIIDVLALFAILCLGIVISVFIMLLEILFEKCKTRKKNINGSEQSNNSSQTEDYFRRKHYK